MSDAQEVTVPDIGDFDDVEIIEVLVAAGDTVVAEQPLITLESDKATMDIPSPGAGTVTEVRVKVGERVSQGTVIAMLAAGDGKAAASSGDAAPAAAGASEAAPAAGQAPAPAPAAPAREAAPAASEGDGIKAEVVVVGAGPGGYTAAFRAADLGLDTVLVERYPTLGGVCLNVGCIPSKALLHAANVIDGAAALASHGVRFGAPEIDPEALRGWKDEVVGQLTKGLSGLAKQRKVRVVQGRAAFESPNVLTVRGESGDERITFDKAIIAAGSEPVSIPGFPEDDPRVMDSTGALELRTVPERLLVIGGGIIGLEMATVYHALGSKVSVVELLDGLMPGCDPDIVRPFAKHVGERYENIWTGTRVTGVAAGDSGIEVTFEGPKAPASDRFDAVLVAVGRRPNGKGIGAEHAGVEVDERGFIPVDRQQRTNVAHIFAIGDIVGQPMLAHKATHEGKVAAEVAAGHKASFDAAAIPSVAYTDPEVAWTGVTEAQAKERGLDYDKATFPWAASGRSLGMGRREGLTKVLFDRETGRLIGAAMVGPHAGDLVAEATLAIEMGADAANLSLTIHPHPTLSETINFAAEMVEGTITDLYLPRKKK